MKIQATQVADHQFSQHPIINAVTIPYLFYTEYNRNEGLQSLVSTI